MTDNKPNVIVIMVDQLTPYMCAAYGNTQVDTPYMQRLAEEGICFNKAYTPCPLCTPARAAFMTGMYPSSLRCYDNASPFPVDTPTIAHYLSNLGYETVLSGKMHFIGADQLHGFEKRLTTDFYPSNFAWLPELDPETQHVIGGGHHAKMYKKPNIGLRDWSHGFSYDEEAHSKAKNFLYERNDERPLFLCVSYHHPHDPFYVTEDLWRVYQDRDMDIPITDRCQQSQMDIWLNNHYHRTDLYDITSEDSLKDLRRSYGALTTYVDNKLGELLTVLEKRNLLENSLVIFTSDHGDMLGERGMVQKRCFYEWSARIPLLVRFPYAKYKGLTVDQPVSLLDIMPFVLDVLGDSTIECNGQSFLPLVKETRNDTEPRFVYSEYVGEGVLSYCAMITDGRYKYTYIHDYDEQLFDLACDPNEYNNLIGNKLYCKTYKKLKQELLHRFNSEQIEQEVKTSLVQRKIIRDAMKKTGTYWDYSPLEDPSKQYHR